MRKIMKIVILLMSIIGCSNNISSTEKCSCADNPLNQECKLTFKLITNINEDDVISINGSYPSQSLSTKVKEENISNFYQVMNREYKLVSNDYLASNFNYERYESYAWYIKINNHILDSITINGVYDEYKNYYFIIPGAIESYLSTPISNDELSFL